MKLKETSTTLGNGATINVRIEYQAEGQSFSEIYVYQAETNELLTLNDSDQNRLENELIVSENL